MLFHNVVHGDLSPFNLLVWESRVHVIDLPHAVDAKKNRHAESLLRPDVERTCKYFARRGIVRDAVGIAEDLWTAWTFADLVPEKLRPTFQIDPITG